MSEIKKDIKKTSNIHIQVGLDEANHPVDIQWSSDDNPNGDGLTEVKAMLLSFFDKEHLDTFKIDLWTPEMQVVEMDRMMFQTLKALADTYQKATRNNELANDMQKFVHYFGLETEIIPKDE